MLKEYTLTNAYQLELNKKDLIFNLSDFQNNEIYTLTSKNNAFKFTFYKSDDFRLPDGYYNKPYPGATVYNMVAAPKTPYQIEYKTNIYNYLNNYSVSLLNQDQTINTSYYGDILNYKNIDYLIYGFTIDYKNNINDSDITTINASGFALNPNGNRYNTMSSQIANYNPLFFYNTNSLNDYYYYNSTLEKQILASPYVNSQFQLGSYELSLNYAYFKDFVNENGTITFNPTPIITSNSNQTNYFNFSNLIDYYVGNNTTINLNYKFGFIASNPNDTVNTENGTEYYYYYNYTDIVQDQTFIEYRDLLQFKENIQYQNNSFYLNTKNNVEINNNNYTYNEVYPTFQPLDLTNKLVSTNNIELTLKTINITDLFRTTILNTNDVFTNMQTVNIVGVSFGMLLSAMLTFTVIVSLLRLGK